MEKEINNFFNDRYSILILLIVSLITIFLSNLIYNYEILLSTQDSSNYILLAKDLKNYFNVPHQDALRIFPSLLAFFLNKMGIDIDISFKILAYFSFIFLNIKLFLLIKSYNIKNYLALSAVAIIIYSNHSIIYSVFNYYQLVDLITYILIIYFIELLRNKNHILLFLISLISIFTKEYLLVLVFTIYGKYIYNNKTTKNIFLLILILIIFLVHNKFASLNYYNDKINDDDLIFLIKSYFNDVNLFINSAIRGLFFEKNIFLFFPFIILLFSINFLNFLKDYLAILIFAAIPLSFSIFLYHNVGNNFFRVFYHGYFIMVFLSIIFLITCILDDKLSKILFFASPLSFLLDFVYIFVNIKQDGFFNYFQIIRYNYLSGFYIFNLMILAILILKFKKIFNKNEKKTFIIRN